MPGHFQQPTGSEANNQTSIGLILDGLAVMKYESPGQGSRLGGKPPNDVYGSLLKDTKAVRNKLLQAEARIALKAVRLEL